MYASKFTIKTRLTDLLQDWCEFSLEPRADILNILKGPPKHFFCTSSIGYVRLTSADATLASSDAISNGKKWRYPKSFQNTREIKLDLYKLFSDMFLDRSQL